MICFGLIVIGLLGYTSAGNLPRLDGKIVGGHAVTIEEYPYQISLQYYRSHMCGGSIIAKRFILTAAHCTDGISSRNPIVLTVRIGSTHHAIGGVVMKVKRIHQHPRYDPELVDNDLSVLELFDDIVYSQAAQSVQLPYDGFRVEDGSNAVVSGWGYTAENGKVSTTLQAVFVPVVSRDVCVQAYAPAKITDNMICAGVVDEGEKDACQGDSGGPLVCNGVLVGIVSWGYGCARPKYPGIYTNVANYKSYIDNVIRS